jgi:hypothetical protein
MEKYMHRINPLKKVVALFLFLSITHLSVYATIAVTQVTHATVNTDVSGTSGAPIFNCDSAIDITIVPVDLNCLLYFWLETAG